MALASREQRLAEEGENVMAELCDICGIRPATIRVRVTRRPSCHGEDLAVEVFLKLWRNPKARGEKVEGWLYRVALRAGLDELRRQTRRARYEGLLGLVRAKRAPVTPEELHLATEEQDRVRFVLSSIEPRQAEFLLLRSQGFSSESVLDWNPPQPRSAGVPEGVHQTLWTGIIQNSARGSTGVSPP